MESAGYSDTTNATVYASSLEDQWLSVRAYGPDGEVGKRAIAIYKSPSIFGCTLDPPVAFISSECAKTSPNLCKKFEDVFH